MLVVQLLFRVAPLDTVEALDERQPLLRPAGRAVLALRLMQSP